MTEHERVGALIRQLDDLNQTRMNQMHARLQRLGVVAIAGWWLAITLLLIIVNGGADQ